METKFREDFLKKEFEGEKNVLNTRIVSIEGASNVGSFSAMQQFFSEKNRPQSPEK